MPNSQVEIFEGAYYSYVCGQTGEPRVAIGSLDCEGGILHACWNISQSLTWSMCGLSAAEERTLELIFDPAEGEWVKGTVAEVKDFEAYDFLSFSSSEASLQFVWRRVGASASPRVKLARLNKELLEAEKLARAANETLCRVSAKRAVALHEMKKELDG